MPCGVALGSGKAWRAGRLRAVGKVDARHGRQAVGGCGSLDALGPHMSLTWCEPGLSLYFFLQKGPVGNTDRHLKF